MNEHKIDGGAGRRCPQCGAELPPNLPAQLCPKCLLKTGLDSQPQAGPAGTVVVGTEHLSRALPQAGERLGHYRICRPLGGGGMGAVFEAEDLENGRRVALKILSQAPDSPESRHRFFREGRLAASINHPNSVYVFGTEEIGGVPLIAMELVAGGTLEDRVRARGPIPAAEAVDAVLQIIAGLEAAQRVGILHRDIKPSNCFVDADGTVKVGDFGLSISTSIRTEPALTATGSFLGTPAFCPPEQLRGEELNARSDIYSVGATLFYLLTGRTPFQAKNVVALLATVLEQPAPSPAQFQPALPRGLSKAVRRCLEKQPAERFGNYDDLRNALAPYGSAAPAPAALGVRFAAGLLDMIVLGLVMGALAMLGPFDYFRFALLPRATPSLLGPNTWQVFAFGLFGLGVCVLYYGLLEGRWGLTVGKLAFGLRVVGTDRNAPGCGRALLSALIYVLAPGLPSSLVFWWNPRAYLGAPTALQSVVGLSFYVFLGLLFSTARRKNGFAAVYDLLTKTRVVTRTAFHVRTPPLAGDLLPPTVETTPVIGPYHVLQTLGDSDGNTWHLGYDMRLLRKVWIRTVPEGTPPVPAQLRNLGRVGRLRWLAGWRSSESNWDSFEALTGRPLLDILRDSASATQPGTSRGLNGRSASPQPWAQVRYWLCDLASELAAAQKDSTLPTHLDLERVWITADGRAKLLDFPAPGLAGTDGSPARLDVPAAPAPPIPAREDSQGIPRFFSQVASAALQGRADAAAAPPEAVSVPLPLHVRRFLEVLPRIPDADAIQRALRPLLERVAVVTPLRRAALVAACAALPLLFGCMYVLGIGMMEDWDRRNRGIFELYQLLQQRSAMQHWAKNQPQPTDREFAIYVASHYRDAITNDASWSSAFALSLFKGESRHFAEQSLAQFPAPIGAETAQADAAIKKFRGLSIGFEFLKAPAVVLLMSSSVLVIYVGLPAIIAALAFRGGLVLLAAGITFVRRDGARASRARLLWRALVAWSPLVPVMLMVGICQAMKSPAFAALALGLYLALAMISALLPGRGLQDRLAGTWPVLR